MSHNGVRILVKTFLRIGSLTAVYDPHDDIHMLTSSVLVLLMCVCKFHFLLFCPCFVWIIYVMKVKSERSDKVQVINVGEFVYDKNPDIVYL